MQINERGVKGASRQKQCFPPKIITGTYVESMFPIHLSKKLNATYVMQMDKIHWCNVMWYLP